MNVNGKFVGSIFSISSLGIGGAPVAAARQDHIRPSQPPISHLRGFQLHHLSSKTQFPSSCRDQSPGLLFHSRLVLLYNHSEEHAEMYAAYVQSKTYPMVARTRP